MGAGPVGLTAATVLRLQGIEVTVLESGPGPSTQSRASTFHPSTLELLDDIGMAEPLLEMGLRAPRFSYRDRNDGVVAEFDLGWLADETRFPFRIQCEQNKLCAIAAERLDADVRFGFEVTGVAASDAGVVVRAGDAEVRGDYLIGADGSRSAVREALGIDYEGLTYPERFLVISTTFEFRDVFDDLAFVNYVADPQEWFVLLRTPDHWRVLFPIPEDEPEDVARSSERIAERLKGISADAALHPIMHASFYRIHQRVAATFRSGRALLAGDAAHINNPLGGMGMNSGLHDAFSIGRRLASVITGEAGDEALDEYAARRRRVAIDIVDAHTRQNYERIRSQDPAVRRAYLDDMRATAADPERAKAYMRKATLLASAREAL